MKKSTETKAKKKSPAKRAGSPSKPTKTPAKRSAATPKKAAAKSKPRSSAKAPAKGASKPAAKAKPATKPAAKAKAKAAAKPVSKAKPATQAKVSAKPTTKAAVKPNVKPAPKAKAAAATKPAAPKAKPAKKVALRREDHPGHLDPKYAASLRALGNHEDDSERAFVGKRGSKDDFAEELGEEAVVAMTSGEDGLGDDLQADVDEDSGGPFLESSGRKEFASGVDASNPRGADREPFPKI